MSLSARNRMMERVGAGSGAAVVPCGAIAFACVLGCASRPASDARGANDPTSLLPDRPAGVGLSATPAELGAQLELHLSVYRVDPALWSALAESQNSGSSPAASPDALPAPPQHQGRQDHVRPGDVVMLSELRGLEVVVFVLDERSAELEQLLASIHREHPRVACVLVVVNDSIAAFDGLALGHGLIAWDPQGVTMAQTGIEEIPGWSVLAVDGRVRAKGEGLDAAALMGALAARPSLSSDASAVARSVGGRGG